MARRKRDKPYKIIGAYDTETTNINDGNIYAFPVTYQLGTINCPIQDIAPDNVRQHTAITIYRHAVDLYTRIDELVAANLNYVPVILCHNLAFDMYSLAPYFDAHECKVLAKSQRKPITFTVLDETGKPALVIWDTLVFSQQPLERMGEDCGYKKAVGNWDYELIRTPDTPLTAQEETYAKDDIYALITWVSWWLSMNPDISPEKLGKNVVTKTGIVREKRKLRFANARAGRYNIGRHWYYINRQQAPKTDDELFTMQAATRGGFTFCASSFASIPYDLENTDMVIAGYDATSQHPAQMVSHMVPVNFHETTPEVLDMFLAIVRHYDTGHILANWAKPFAKAVYAAYEFTNIRPKAGSIFEQWGILPLASARFTSNENMEMDEENGDALTQDDNRRKYGYADTAANPVYAFGKLVSADSCIVYVTELALWEICQCYEWDNAQAVHGYITGRFVRPSDMAIVSVMQFYQAKNEYKQARDEYYKHGKIANNDKLRKLGVADAIVSDMEAGTLSPNDIEATYLGLKANLNALFGIEASNEYRRDTMLTANGIEYAGEFGICNAPKNPKAWYQYGQRIVGWSRIAQICTMQLCRPYIEGVINGDTDSVKLLCRESELNNIDRALGKLAHAIDSGKRCVCARIRANYPQFYDSLDGIGYYVREFVAKRFCAAWNKAYVEYDEKGYHFTLAGVPSSDIYKKDDAGELQLMQKRVNGIANDATAAGMSFAEVCNTFLGYNVTFTPDVTGLNARKFPAWGDLVNVKVTDYLGNTSHVIEPAALALYPMAKTVGSFAMADNRANARYALANNPDVNTNRVFITQNGIVGLDNE